MVRQRQQQQKVGESKFREELRSICSLSKSYGTRLEFGVGAAEPSAVAMPRA